MALLKDNSVLHPAPDADFTAFTYTQVYCQRTATVTINGTSITMVGGSTLDVRVKDVSSVPDIILIGSPINTLKAGLLL